MKILFLWAILIDDATMKIFCQIYDCKILSIIRPISKTAINPTCIDLIITNRPNSFQEFKVIKIGLSDFHKMSVTVMKVFYNKQKLGVIQCKKYNDFSNKTFIHELESTLLSFSQILFGTFKSIVDNILQKHAPIKNRYVRANQASLRSSKMHKEIVRKTRLRNKFIDSKTEADRIAYNKKPNYCVSLIRKEKRHITVTLKYVT